MSYLHIENLYKNNQILAFREVFALEKIHGSSAHILFDGHQVRFSSGGMKHTTFKNLFDEASLRERFISLGHLDTTIIIYGEAYGGNMQGMSKTYGNKAAFIAFDVKIGGLWLDVPKAEDVVNKLGLEFVPYAFGPTSIEWLNEQRDADSIVAIRRGCGEGKKREGIVIRPPFEVRLNNDERLIVKHKRSEFKETKTDREIDPEQLKVLEDAKDIAEEWATSMRLEHVLQKIEPPHTMENIQVILYAMVEDVLRESKGEIIDSLAARKSIMRKTSILYKDYLNKVLADG